ncbi:MAG: NTP transferase domain-containing protein [Deltaproteobacteria bacterium]|nr:NTP transferase domain-containing protein [Deltaproteobacteria bacterium]
MLDAACAIMAGGAGTRFWPLSRLARPKQLLALTGGGRSLLQLAWERARALFPPGRILVVTGERLVEAVAAQLPGLPRSQILAEPTPRSTAPCIGWAAARVRREFGDVPLAAVPSDQLIEGEAAYGAAFARATALAREGWIATFGIPPARPETGFGYVQAGAALGDDAFAVARFLEKPDRAKAERLLADGGVFWNSGMFVFSVGRMLDELRARLPETGRFADAVAAVDPAGEARLVAERFAGCEAISIDYGVMERAERVAVVAAAFSWSDVGSWDAVADRVPAGVPADGPLVFLKDAPRAYVRAEAAARKIVAVVGVDDVIVVDTEDALLVCRRGSSQDVRAVVDELKARGRKDLL